MKKTNDGKGPARKSSAGTSSGRSRIHHASPRRVSSGRGARTTEAPKPKTCGPLCPGPFCAGSPVGRQPTAHASAAPRKDSLSAEEILTRTVQVEIIPTEPKHTGLGSVDLTAPEIIEDKDFEYWIPAGVFHKDKGSGTDSDAPDLSAFDEVPVQSGRRQTLEHQGVLALTAPDIISEDEEVIREARKSVDIARKRASMATSTGRPAHEQTLAQRLPLTIEQSTSPTGWETPIQIVPKVDFTESFDDSQFTCDGTGGRFNACGRHAKPRRSYWVKSASEGLLCPGASCRGLVERRHRSEHVCARRVTIDQGSQFPTKPKVWSKSDENQGFKYQAIQHSTSGSKTSSEQTRAAASAPVALAEDVVKDLTAPEVLEARDLGYSIPAAVVPKDQDSKIQKIAARVGQNSPRRLSPVFLTPVHVSPPDTGMRTALEDKVIRALSTPGLIPEEQLIKALTAPGVILEEHELTSKSSGENPPESNYDNAMAVLVKAPVDHNTPDQMTASVGISTSKGIIHNTRIGYDVARDQVNFVDPEPDQAVPDQTGQGLAPASVSVGGIGVGTSPVIAGPRMQAATPQLHPDQLPPGPNRWKQIGRGAVISVPSEMWETGTGVQAPPVPTRRDSKQLSYSQAEALHQIYPYTTSQGHIGRGLHISIPQIAPVVPLVATQPKVLTQQEGTQRSESSGIAKFLAIAACLLCVVCATGIHILKP